TVPKTQTRETEEGPLAQLADDHSELARRWDREHNEHVVRQLLDMIAAEFSATHVLAFRRQGFDEARAADGAAELGLSSNAVLVAKCRILGRLREIGQGLLD